MTETEWYVQPGAAAAAAAAAVAAAATASEAAQGSSDETPAAEEAAAAAAAPAPAPAPAPSSTGLAPPAPSNERRPSGAGSGGRRRSWHIKMERKRRKGVFGSGGALGPSAAETPRLLAAADRHKRPSWWNIFVPDHWPGHRSRRASQDLPRTSDTGALPWQRSKSRSVDHGFSAPFDLDSLRSKVEGRFESVDRLTRGDSDGGKDGLADRRPTPKAPPVHTTTYTVSAHDTLTSVAARFDTTPSELAEINRLATRLVFPGQVLQVPLKDGAPAPAATDAQEPATADGAASAAPMPDVLGEPVLAAPAAEGLAAGERPTTPLQWASCGTPPPSAASTSSASASVGPLPPPPATECRFLKINVRHITDGQGVVSGVLLVTPNAVMFDPNVSDPLVIEHGPESYGVIAPMEFVANAAIYHDIAHMRVSSADKANGAAPSAASGPRPEVYHPARARSPGKDSLLPKDETFPELQAAQSAADDDAEDGDIASSAGSSRDGDAFPKAFDRDRVTPTPGAPPRPSSSDSADANTSRQVSLDSCPSPAPLSDLERRRSTLDHHWPQLSLDKANGHQQQQGGAGPGEGEGEGDGDAAGVDADGDAGGGALVKLSCHDSGIDIRDGPAGTAPSDTSRAEDQEDEEPEIIMPSKKVFSDADIILAPKTEWVPPVTTYNTVLGNNSISHTSSLEAPSTGDSARKKTSSVSFSLESNPESDSRDSEDSHKTEDSEKQETRKTKVLKRLSYPLAWMEGLTGEKDEKDILTGLPHHQSAEAPAGDSQHHASVFSKVFSSSPMNLVDFGTGLFLTKTPSEESSKSPGPGPPPPTPATLNEGGPAAEGRSSVGTFIRQPTTHQERLTPAKPPAPKLDYRSMVSVEDMPELFVSFDKLIPRPARSCEDPPLYLRLRMGKPIDKKIPKSTPIMSYGKKKMRPEYWFSVPRNRVDELYNFLLSWVPHLYGDLEEVDPASRGYELVESDTELWEDEAGGGAEGGRGRRSGSGSGAAGEDADLGDLTRESWEVLKAPYVKLYTILKTQTVSSESEAAEVLSMSEELRRALYASSAGSLDLDPFVPELVGTTEVLTEEHRKQLCRHLPARAEGYVWTLVFSTSQHGFSLNSMYRKMSRLESPILLVIEDTEHNVFGALTSCSLKVSDHFYGTGESLLFRFSPEFQVFNWTGDNMYFIKGNNESLAIGAGDGKFGLWLDGDLYQGRTQPCSTYGNEPLAPQEDFVVKTLECWAFI